MDGQEVLFLIAAQTGREMGWWEARVAGRVLVGEGDQVNPGDVLARLSAPGEG